MSDAPGRRPPRPTTVAVLCHDRPGAQDARRAATAAHLRWVESMLPSIALAGPLYDEAGERMVGSVYVFRTGDLAQARAWLESDPYHAAGIWGNIEFRPFLPAAGEYVGGRNW